MKEVNSAEITEIQLLSEKIDKDLAELVDYKRYEQLLIKAGFEENRVRSKMHQYGYFSYEEYLNAKAKATTREQRKIFDVFITSSFVVLFAILLYWIASGIVKKNK